MFGFQSEARGCSLRGRNRSTNHSSARFGRGHMPSSSIGRPKAQDRRKARHEMVGSKRARVRVGRFLPPPTSGLLNWYRAQNQIGSAVDASIDLLRANQRKMRAYTAGLRQGDDYLLRYCSIHHVEIVIEPPIE